MASNEIVHPYREPATVETPEQRVARTRQIYYAMGAINIAGRSAEERKQIDRGFERARDAYLKAIAALEVSRRGG